MEVGRRRHTADLKSQQSHLVISSLLNGQPEQHVQQRHGKHGLFNSVMDVRFVSRPSFSFQMQISSAKLNSTFVCVSSYLCLAPTPYVATSVLLSTHSMFGRLLCDGRAACSVDGSRYQISVSACSSTLSVGTLAGLVHSDAQKPTNHACHRVVACESS